VIQPRNKKVKLNNSMKFQVFSFKIIRKFKIWIQNITKDSKEIKLPSTIVKTRAIMHKRRGIFPDIRI
jgi:hypothetical protein